MDLKFKFKKGSGSRAVPKTKNPRAPRREPVPQLTSGPDNETLEQMSDRIIAAFGKEGASEIDADSYGKIVLFLLRYGLFDTAEGVSLQLGEEEWLDLWEVKGQMVAIRTRELLQSNNMMSLADMYSHRTLSDAIVRNGTDLTPYLASYLAAHCLTSVDVGNVKAKLHSVFPDDAFYANAIDKVDIDVAEAVRLGPADGPATRPAPRPAPVEEYVPPTIDSIVAAEHDDTVPAFVGVTPVPEVPVPVPVPVYTEEQPLQAAEPEEEPPEPETDPTVIYINGMDVTVMPKPLGYGSYFKAYRAVGTRNKPYVLRTLLDEDPFAYSHLTIPDYVLEDIAFQESIWYDMARRYPDTFVRILDSSESPFTMQLVEFADATFEDKAASMPVQDRVTTVITMMNALACLHREGIIHNDVKTSNMYRVLGRWKLSGFDAAFRAGDAPRNSNGTFEFMSPEQYNEEGICAKSDIWSAGVVLYHVLTGKYPFDGRGNQYRNNVLAARFRPRDLDPRYVPLLTEMFSQNPEDRPTAEEVADELAGILYG